MRKVWKGHVVVKRGIFAQEFGVLEVLWFGRVHERERDFIAKVEE